MAWSRKQNEELIRIYEEHPLLYKDHLPGSRDKGKREEAYFKIAYEIQDVRLGTTVEEIKRRIKNLRTQYFKEKKRITSLRLQGSDCVKLWCYESLRFLNEDNKNEERLEPETRTMKQETEEYIDENIENVGVDTSDTLCSENQFLEQQNQEDDMLSNVDYESVEDDLNVVDSADTMEAPYPAKRFRASDNTEMEHLKHHPAENTVEICRDGNISESFAIKLNKTLDRTNALLSKLTYTKQSQNRPFIENLLLDLNRLPQHALIKTKWKITDIVYQAYQEQQERQNSRLSS